MHIGRPGSRARPRLLCSTGAPRQVGNLTNQAVHRTAWRRAREGPAPGGGAGPVGVCCGTGEASTGYRLRM
jgi:hypothetical protein